MSYLPAERMAHNCESEGLVEGLWDVLRGREEVVNVAVQVGVASYFGGVVLV